MKQAFLATLFLFSAFFGSAQKKIAVEQINPDLLSKRWDAVWITDPGIAKTSYGVYYFRKIFELSSKPQQFIVHVSADNRYELYVNGQRAVLGPSWGDLHHWRFESIDIAPYLKEGENIIAAQVVNFGALKAISQFSFKTGFILQGDSEIESMLNTNADSWEVLKAKAYKPIKIDWRVLSGYYAANPCDAFDAQHHYWNWKEIHNDYPWQRPERGGAGTPRHAGHYFKDQSPWLLVPRKIPFLEESKQYFVEIEKTENISVDPGFLYGDKKLIIPANTKATILLDQKEHSRAYTEIYFSGGKNSRIKIEYGEALQDSLRKKGNRDDIEGKYLRGYYDVILPDGGQDRFYRTLWHRVFRYVEVQIETEDEPLTIDSLYTLYTAYPYELRSKFKTDQQVHEQLFAMGWRTLRNGTAEVFEDGPYYEQLMYAGDARTESIVSLYMSGDERMSKNIIDLFDNSRMPEGLTLSRYPSNHIQINPQYSLCWIQTIHDYWMYGSDTAFAGNYLDGIAAVLNWYTKLIDETGMLGEVPWLRHIENMSGTPRHPERGHSAQQTLFFALTLDYAADLFRYYGYAEKADEYQLQTKKLKEATFRLCWDQEKALLGDTPEKDVYTQHANVLGILTDAIPEKKHKQVMEKVLGDTSLVQSYLFFKFWIFQAMDKSGLGNEYLDNIGSWEELIDYGLTTFPERSVESRSDCHPWGAHINYFFLTTVAGIKPADPGFKHVLIKPHPGKMKFVQATVPHHKGEITVYLDLKKKKQQQAVITLPAGLFGTFIWEGEQRDLFPGKQTFSL